MTGTSLVAQWLRICLVIQGIRVWSLVGELHPTCCGATKPARRNYWAQDATKPQHSQKQKICGPFLDPCSGLPNVKGRRMPQQDRKEVLTTGIRASWGVGLMTWTHKPLEIQGAFYSGDFTYNWTHMTLSQKDPLEKDMAVHSSNLAWRIPWTEEPGGLQSIGSQRVTWARLTKDTAEQLTL